MEEQQQSLPLEQTTASETKPQVVVAETANPEETHATNAYIERANGLYHEALVEIRKTKLTRGSVLRAWDYAATRGLSTRSLKVKPRGDAETRLSELFTIVLENRLLLMAAQLNAQKAEEAKENTDDKQN